MARDIDRDIRELAQAVATLEVVLTRLAEVALTGRDSHKARFAAELGAWADHAVFQRDGLEPVMLDRIVERLGAH